MKANLSKKLLTGFFLTVQLLTCSITSLASGGAIAGGGGDGSEERVSDIRSDILLWINNGGAKKLSLPQDISYGQYVDSMTAILQPKKVIIEFTQDKVMVENIEKTCMGFLSTVNDLANIKCNISRFKEASESQKYRLIHHEFAGLVGVEKNEGAASDYVLSSQITDFLIPQTVLKLAVKKRDGEIPMPSDDEYCLARYEEGIYGFTYFTVCSKGSAYSEKFHGYSNKTIITHQNILLAKMQKDNFIVLNAIAQEQVSQGTGSISRPEIPINMLTILKKSNDLDEVKKQICIVNTQETYWYLCSKGISLLQDASVREPSKDLLIKNDFKMVATLKTSKTNFIEIYERAAP